MKIRRLSFLGCFLIALLVAETGIYAQVPLDEQAYERARQKLRESIQSQPPSENTVITPSIDVPKNEKNTLGQSPSTDAETVKREQTARKALDNLDQLISQTKPLKTSSSADVIQTAAAGPAVPADTKPAPLPDRELPAPMKLLDDKQKLGVGDRVSFRVLEDREEPKSIVLTDSGELEVPYVGRYKAVDKTCFQLAQEIKTLLEKDYYHRATVIISVDALSRTRGKVYLVGAVRTPGPVEIPVDETYTVGKVILRAGGFADFADKRHVKLMRKPDATGKATETHIINVQDIWEKGKTANDLTVQPDDMIFVPQKLVNF